MEIDLKQLRELMRALKQFDVNELEIERGEERIFLRRGSASGAVAQATFPAAHVTPAPPQHVPPRLPAHVEAPAREDEDDPSIVYITSPFVGTFYRSPSPDAPPFVEPGTRIKPGQVLCIVEAMKLMNEIESEIEGTIVEILVDNGKPVEYGDQLFRVKK